MKLEVTKQNEEAARRISTGKRRYVVQRNGEPSIQP